MIAGGVQPYVNALLAASPPGVAPSVAALIDTIDFSAFNAYASSWEKTALRSYPEASVLVLTDPAIPPKVTELRDWLLSSWLSGESAANKDQLYAEALSLTLEPGSALILCYHVCQMFARGFKTVYWQRVETWIDWDAGGPIPAGAKALPTLDPASRDDYYDGTKFYRPVELDGALSGEVLQVGVPPRDTIFYLLFDKNDELGVGDPGDWYQFFLMASIAYYTATGRATDRDLPENITEQLITGLVRSTLQGMQKVGCMPEVPFGSMDSYDAAWLWANALSFVEGGMFGLQGDPDMSEAIADVTRECNAHRTGCLYGLRLAGKTYHPGYLHWWVPTPQGLGRQFGISIAGSHPFDATGIALDRNRENEFWEFFIAVGFNDDSIQEFLNSLRTQGPAHGRAIRVLDGTTGAVLTSHPVAGYL